MQAYSVLQHRPTATQRGWIPIMEPSLEIVAKAMKLPLGVTVRWRGLGAWCNL